MNLRLFVAFLALLVCALMVFGCDDFFVDDSDLVSISVSPASDTIEVAETQPFTATGTLAGGGTRDVTDTATWTSSNTAIATINTAGVAVGVSPGSTNITASQGGVSATVGLTVDQPALSSISITPTNPTPLDASNPTQQFTADGTFSDSSTRNITNAVTWNSSNTNVATISSSGLATRVAAGTTNITATLGSVTSNSVALTVN
ncbi:MAG TPA: Ig-like domain-containing protein [Terriglobales bacterium]|jgi:hypothetical protein|nr:Ig-like domain-containing protein [Terriglobales bacterium]